jgi:hypothetical protein
VRAAAVLFGEKLPVNHGFGWDACFYGCLASNFPTHMFFELPEQGVN